MFTYKEENVQNDFNRLLDLYLNSDDDNYKKEIYSQMLFMYCIDNKMAKKYKVTSYRPKNYFKYLSIEERNKRKEYLKLDGFSTMICNYLKEELDKYYYLRSFDLNRKCSFEEYKNIIENFFKEVFPNDLELLNRDINSGNLIIKKDILFSSADIYYLQELNKYYIAIKYYKYLNAFNIASTIHEYGHASTFMHNGNYKSKDYILEEVISTLYELVFLRFYSDNYCNNSTNIEMLSVFNGYCISKLNNSLSKMHYYNNRMINMLSALYGQLIAVTIYTKYYDSVLDKISILKDNYSSVSGFELLESIGVTKDDLLDTSRDISRLILKR